jgi:hypothetical protein
MVTMTSNPCPHQGDVDVHSLGTAHISVPHNSQSAQATRLGNTNRLPAEISECQKEKAQAFASLLGTDALQAQQGGSSNLPRNSHILRGPKKLAEKYYSCPEEWGMSAGRRANEVRSMPGRHACPCCVAAGAVFTRGRSK